MSAMSLGPAPAASIAGIDSDAKMKNAGLACGDCTVPRIFSV